MSRILVTGANRGIGLALCEALAARGDEIIGVCRRTSEALAACATRVIEGIDVAVPEDLARLAEALEDASLDVVIANAGRLSSQRLGAIDASAIEEMLTQYRINAIGPVLTAQALRPKLRRPARIAIITSRMGSIADNDSGGSYGYRMSKAAVNMAGVSLARDLAGDEISVGLIHPGFVRTEMTGGQGLIEASEAAAGIIARIDELTAKRSGSFRHSNGESLPW
ncbi:MAG: SDR family oxidoreductase [Gammaproteobacteria bacterium]|nr:MAG: SDR family oxidoreductase [Gammaproteobacteria bacterium]